MLIIVIDIYEVLFHGNNYPFGKEDLGILYKSKNHYLSFSFIFVGWLVLAYLFKKKNLLIAIHAVITFSYLLIKVIF